MAYLGGDDFYVAQTTPDCLKDTAVLDQLSFCPIRTIHFIQIHGHVPTEAVAAIRSNSFIKTISISNCNLDFLEPLLQFPKLRINQCYVSAEHARHIKCRRLDIDIANMSALRHASITKLVVTGTLVNAKSRPNKRLKRMVANGLHDEGTLMVLKQALLQHPHPLDVTLRDNNLLTELRQHNSNLDPYHQKVTIPGVITLILCLRQLNIHRDVIPIITSFALQRHHTDQPKSFLKKRKRSCTPRSAQVIFKKVHVH